MAHFRHNKQVDKALALACERRVARYHAEDLARLERSLHSSRQRYITRKFWAIFSDYFEQSNFPVSYILDSVHPRERELGQYLASAFRREPIEQYLEGLSNIVNSEFTGQKPWFVNPLNPQYGLCPSVALQQNFIDSIATKINRNLHKVIIEDVLRFLHTQPKSWDICVSLFTLAVHCLIEALKDSSSLGLVGGDEAWLVPYNEKIGVNLNFWQIQQNRYIFLSYSICHILTWISIVPYSLILKNETN